MKKMIFFLLVIFSSTTFHAQIGDPNPPTHPAPCPNVCFENTTNCDYLVCITAAAKDVTDPCVEGGAVSDPVTFCISVPAKGKNCILPYNSHKDCMLCLKFFTIRICPANDPNKCNSYYSDGSTPWQVGYLCSDNLTTTGCIYDPATGTWIIKKP